MVFNALQSIKGSFFTFLSVNSCWDCNHLSSLKRIFEDNSDCYAAYSSFEVQKKEQLNGFETSSFSNLVYDGNLDIGSILRFSHHIPEYSVLFKRSIFEGILLRHLYFFDNIDCRFEVSLFLVNALLKGKILFSQQMTAKFFGTKNNADSKQQPPKKKEVFCDLEQAIYLNDYFRNNEKYKQLCAIYAVNNGDISSGHYDTFKIYFKQLIKDIIGNKPLPQSIARMFYRLFKRLINSHLFK